MGEKLMAYLLKHLAPARQKKHIIATLQSINVDLETTGITGHLEQLKTCLNCIV
jgi:hypothetical protein